MGLNHRPYAYEASALPTELHCHFGGNSRSRTYDLQIKSLLLCQLSYASILYLHQALHLHLRFSADALTYRISQIQAYTIHELNNLLSYGDMYIFYEFFGVEHDISRHSNLQVV